MYWKFNVRISIFKDGKWNNILMLEVVFLRLGNEIIV